MVCRKACIISVIRATSDWCVAAQPVISRYGSYIGSIRCF